MKKRFFVKFSVRNKGFLGLVKSREHTFTFECTRKLTKEEIIIVEDNLKRDIEKSVRKSLGGSNNATKN